MVSWDNRYWHNTIQRYLLKLECLRIGLVHTLRRKSLNSSFCTQDVQLRLVRYLSSIQWFFIESNTRWQRSTSSYYPIFFHLQWVWLLCNFQLLCETYVCPKELIQEACFEWMDFSTTWYQIWPLFPWLRHSLIILIWA